MSHVVIRVEGLGKKYIIGHQRNGSDGLRHVLQDKLTAPLRWAKSKAQRAKVEGLSGKSKEQSAAPPLALSPSPLALSPLPFAPRVEDFWALRDVSFSVSQGEVVGIIGRNGAGKSTLLKILSRITEPTEGRVRIRGRVASLLEVGTGFHPELTGRENVFLNGAILGMSKEEIKRKFDEIVAFAEVEKFLDTPVKRYSSGMYVRLAFAVAAHLEPEILIVDEVLAVGDAQFQKKCLGKMGEVSKEGRTVLFVSHNMTAVKALCNTALWLDRGVIAGLGGVHQVTDSYLQTGASSVLERSWHDSGSVAGDDTVRLRHVSITPLAQEPDEPITIKTPIRFNAEFWNSVPGAVLNFSVVLYNLEGVAIFNTGSGGHAFPEGLVSGSFVIPADFLNDGNYTIRLLIVKDTSVPLLDVHDLLVFEVKDCDRAGNWYGKVVGAVRPTFDWELSIGNQLLEPVSSFGDSSLAQRR